MMRMTVEAAFGLLGALIFLGTIYYSKKTLEHLRNHRDISLAHFFIEERGEEAFIFLSITAFIYALSMNVTALELLLRNEILLLGSRTLILGVSGMLLYFTREIYLITKKKPEKE